MNRNELIQYLTSNMYYRSGLLVLDLSYEKGSISPVTRRLDTSNEEIILLTTTYVSVARTYCPFSFKPKQKVSVICARVKRIV
jgi:hypothetical protein